MALELALVEPPPRYEVSPPASYQEAGRLLYSSAMLAQSVVEKQPAQETYAQILTAQSLKELGRGWEAVFEVAAPDPASPQPGEVRFSWQPGGTLNVVLPQEVGPDLCKGVEGLYRAATWQEVMENGSGMRLNQLTGEFEWRYEENLKGGISKKMEEAVGDATTTFYGMLIRFNDDGSALMTDTNIQWGGVEACLTALADSYRNSQ